MKKIVINIQYGGFGISMLAAKCMATNGSKHAQAELDEFQNKTGVNDLKYPHRWHGYGNTEHYIGYERDDPLLVHAVELLAEKANGSHAKLKVVEIPDDVDWEIVEHDGMEHIAEKHRTWY